MDESSSNRWTPLGRWWTDSNLGVAAVGAGVSAGTYPLARLEVDPAVIVLGACGAFVIYQLDRAVCPSPEDRRNHPARLAWVRAHPGYVRWSTAAAAAVVGSLLVGRPPASWFLAALLGASGLAYALRDRLFGGDGPGPTARGPADAARERRGRLEAFKPASLALVWATGAVGLPLCAEGAPIAWTTAGGLTAYRFGCVLPNLLLSDWPDRRGDRAVGRPTPAVRWSEVRLVRVCRAVLACTVGAGAWAVTWGGAPVVLAVDLGGPLATLLLLRVPLPEQRWFYDVLLDGLIGWPALTLAVAGLS